MPKALLVLEQNLESEDERVRQRAAETVLDRAWGKAIATVAEEGPWTHPLLPDYEELMAMSREELEQLANGVDPFMVIERSQDAPQQ